MRKLLSFFTLMLLAGQAFPQDTLLTMANQKRRMLNKNGMLVLGSWAAGNIITGAVGSGQAHGEAKYFHQMNVYWNLVNLGLSGFGFYNALKSRTDQPLGEALKEQHKLEKTFLFNTGLDIAYVAGGLYLHEKGKTSAKNKLKLKGYGNSVIMQGAFLFLFDAAMYGLHTHNGKKINKLVESLQVNATPSGASVTLNFKMSTALLVSGR